MNLTLTQIVLLLQVYSGKKTTENEQEEGDFSTLLDRDLICLEKREYFDMEITDKGAELVREILRVTQK